VLGAGRRATRTVETGGDVSSDLSALRGRLQAARVELDLANMRSEFGNLFGAVLGVLFIYSIALTLSAQWPAYKNIITPIATAIFTVVMVRMLLGSTYPLRTFGVTTENWRRSLLESMAFTAPIVAAMWIARLALHDRVEPGSPFANFDIDLRFLAYPLIVPLQEIMLRGAVQTSLTRFLIGKHHTLRAIVLSSILFGTTHMHISLPMTFTTILLSLGWGSLYARHRTLIGVSVSHYLIGMFGFALWGSVFPGWQ
jgi:CRP/FNR family transcriptional regulator, cyclic AMP receptor protein